MQKHADKLRFLIVGTGNTAGDFLIMNICASLIGLPVVIANIISTTIMMCVSFVANKKFTFKATGKNYRREVVLFFLFTIIGAWVIQTGLIHLIVLAEPDSWGEFIQNNIAKVIATGVSMCWNFVTYKKFVFNTK